MIDNINFNELVKHANILGARYQVVGGNLVNEVADIKDKDSGEITENVGWSVLTYTGEVVPEDMLDKHPPITSVFLNHDTQYICAKCHQFLSEIKAEGMKKVYSTLEWGRWDGLTEEWDTDSLSNDDYEGRVIYRCPHCEAEMPEIDEDIIEMMLSHNDGARFYPDLRNPQAKKREQT